MKIAIRADGGPDIGYGHLIRTGAIAHECVTAGDDVLYITRTPEAVTEVLPKEVTPIEVSESDEVAETVQYLRENAVDILFTDSYVSDTEYQKRVSNTETTIAVRHNYQQHTVCCDLLISGDLHAVDLEYDWVGSKPQFCLGPEYILLREEFRQIAGTDAVWNETPTRALIVMGGSDIKNVTPTVLNAFDQFDGCVDVVVGPGFSNIDEIQQTAAAVDTECNLLFDPDNMAEIMHRADVAVTTCGGTVFELLAARTPFVGIPLVENQQQRAAALRNRELALILNDVEQIATSIEKITSNSYRRELYEHIEGVVDGRGAERVYDEICSAVNK